jgi:hypothetical protein
LKVNIVVFNLIMIVGLVIVIYSPGMLNVSVVRLILIMAGFSLLFGYISVLLLFGYCWFVRGH